MPILIKPILHNLLFLSSDSDTKDNCWIPIDADIGTEDIEKGVNIFCFYVVSLKRLEYVLNYKDVQLGRSLIIVKEFSEEAIKDKINSILEKCQGETWEEVAMKINRYGDWEYDDSDYKLILD